MKEKNKHVFLYGAFLLLLCFHFLFSLLYSQPYPSLVFPSFSGVPKKVNFFEVQSRKLYAITVSNDTVKVNESIFFPNLAKTYISDGLHQIELKERQKEHLTANFKMHRKNFTRIALVKLKEQFPDKSFRALLIQKNRQVYSVNNKVSPHISNGKALQSTLILLQ